MSRSQYQVTCPDCGNQPLTEEDYNFQMSRPNSTWRCPVCRQEAYWDDEGSLETNPEEPEFYNGIEWFACWLLDNAEGEKITEEQLRPWAIKAWQDHLARTPSTAPQSNADEAP